MIQYLPLLGQLIDKIVPNKEEQQKAKIELNTLLATQEGQALLGQLEINAQEAKHPSVFVAGWRPFVGWAGGLGLVYASILEPVMRFIATMNGYDGEFPILDTTITMQVLMGMLGLGAMRTYEKKHGKDTKGHK